MSIFRVFQLQRERVLEPSAVTLTASLKAVDPQTHTYSTPVLA